MDNNGYSTSNNKPITEPEPEPEPEPIPVSHHPAFTNHRPAQLQTAPETRQKTMDDTSYTTHAQRARDLLRAPETEGDDRG